MKKLEAESINYFTTEEWAYRKGNDYEDDNNNEDENIEEKELAHIYYGPWARPRWTPTRTRYLGGLTYPCNVPHCGLSNSIKAYPVSMSDALCRLHDEELQHLTAYEACFKHHPADDRLIEGFWKTEAWKEANILIPSILFIYVKTCFPLYKQTV